MALDSGVPIQDVQYEGGHASVTTTMLYLKQSAPYTRKPHREAIRLAV